MFREKYIRLQFDIIETYIQEHGQDTGTVSWQMALESLASLRQKVSLSLVSEPLSRYSKTLKMQG